MKYFPKFTVLLVLFGSIDLFADVSIDTVRSRCRSLVSQPGSDPSANPEACTRFCQHSDDTEALNACLSRYRTNHPRSVSVPAPEQIPEEESEIPNGIDIPEDLLDPVIQGEEIHVTGNPNRSWPRSRLEQVCATENEEAKNLCMRMCARNRGEARLTRCANIYKISYEWGEDGGNRKIITSNSCGGNKICIGDVSYTNAQGQMQTRLAVCGSEHCGDDSANECAHQSGFGSESFEDYQASRSSPRETNSSGGNSRQR